MRLSIQSLICLCSCTLRCSSGFSSWPYAFRHIYKTLPAIIDSHTIMHLLFADDLLIQMFTPPDKISEQLRTMQLCISDVKVWATAKILMLDDIKQDLMLVTSIGTKHIHNLPTSFTIGNSQIPFKQSMRNYDLKQTVILLCIQCLQYCSDMLR